MVRYSIRFYIGCSLFCHGDIAKKWPILNDKLLKIVFYIRELGIITVNQQQRCKEHMRLKRTLHELLNVFRNRKLANTLINNYSFFTNHKDLTAWGSITEEDEKGIQRAVGLAASHPGSIIEVGSLFGHTCNYIATLKDPQKELIAIENFAWNPFALPKEAHKKFLERTLRVAIEHRNTRIYEGNVVDFYLANRTMKPSMVFIDAEHDYASVKRDIDWALSVGCKVISGHDYTSLHPGVVKAVDEAFGRKIEVWGSVWIYQNAGL